MVDPGHLKAYLQGRSGEWLTAQEIADGINQGENWRDVRNELPNLRTVLPGGFGFEDISPGSTDDVVLRQDSDELRYHWSATMKPDDYASVVSAYMARAIEARPSESKHYLEMASTYLVKLQEQYL